MHHAPGFTRIDGYQSRGEKWVVSVMEITSPNHLAANRIVSRTTVTQVTAALFPAEHAESRSSPDESAHPEIQNDCRSN
jgi:hypothetical protein